MGYGLEGGEGVGVAGGVGLVGWFCGASFGNTSEQGRAIDWCGICAVLSDHGSVKASRRSVVRVYFYML